MNALQNLLNHNSSQAAWMVAIAIILAVVVPLYKMMRASTDVRDLARDAMMANSGASLSLTAKGFAGKSLVVKLDKDTVQKARDLIRAGADLESVCHEIEPAYADWRTIQQQAFRRAIEMVLTSAPTVQN
jgi:hypothetical protein